MGYTYVKSIYYYAPVSAPGGGFADFANFGSGGAQPQQQQNTAFPQSQSGIFICLNEIAMDEDLF